MKYIINNQEYEVDYCITPISKPSFCYPFEVNNQRIIINSVSFKRNGKVYDLDYDLSDLTQSIIDFELKYGAEKLNKIWQVKNEINKDWLEDKLVSI